MFDSSHTHPHRHLPPPSHTHTQTHHTHMHVRTHTHTHTPHIFIHPQTTHTSLSPDRTRQCVRLISLSALDSGELKNSVVKVTETEGATLFTTGSLGPTVYVCAAVKNKVVILEINRTKQRYEKKKVETLMCVWREYT